MGEGRKVDNGKHPRERGSRSSAVVGNIVYCICHIYSIYHKIYTVYVLHADMDIVGLIVVFRDESRYPGACTAAGTKEMGK